MKRRVYRLRSSLGWWLMGCPFTHWPEETKVPWDYRLGMRIMPGYEGAYE